MLQGKDVHVSMHGCIVSGAANYSVWVIGHAKATLDGCTISKNDGYGVYCKQGGRVVARQVHRCGNKQAGFLVLGDSSMTLKECSSDKDEIGCAALGACSDEPGTARIVLSGVLVRRSTAAGFYFDSDARGCMKHCVALQCGIGGMRVKAAAHLSLIHISEPTRPY